MININWMTHKIEPVSIGKSNVISINWMTHKIEPVSIGESNVISIHWMTHKPRYRSWEKRTSLYR